MEEKKDMEELNTAETIGPIVATADPVPHALTESSVLHNSGAHAELRASIVALQARVRQLEAAVEEMRTVKASAESTPSAGRKTLPFAPVSLLAKGAAEQTGAASVDDALRSLSIEQRIAVKSGLLRAGLMK